MYAHLETAQSRPRTQYRLYCSFLPSNAKYICLCESRTKNRNEWNGGTEDPLASTAPDETP